MDGLHKSFRDAKYISSVDMESGFWNAPLEGGETQALTAFNSVLGKFQFKCAPMGLQPASGFFQMWVEEALDRHDCLYTGPDAKRRDADGDVTNFCAAFQDDLIYWLDSYEEHVEQTERLVAALSFEGIKLNASKVHMFCSYVRYLGCIVGNEELHMDPLKVKAIDDMASPADILGVRQFLGCCSFYRNFIPGFAEICSPLTDLLKKVPDPNGSVDPQTGKIRKVHVSVPEQWTPQCTAYDPRRWGRRI